MEVDPTRVCELLVGLGDVEVLGVDGEAGGPLRVHIRRRAPRPVLRVLWRAVVGQRRAAGGVGGPRCVRQGVEAGVSFYVKARVGLVFRRSVWRCVQMRSEMRRLRARMASRLVLPRSRCCW